MADTSESVRGLLVTPVVGLIDLTDLIERRAYVDVSPQLDQLVNNLCQPSDIKNYIWLSRTSTDRDQCLAEAGSLPDIELFDVECVSRDLAAAKTMANRVHRLDGYRTTFNIGIAPVTEVVFYDVFVEDQSDEYQSRSGAIEFGLFVTSLSIRVVKNG